MSGPRDEWDAIGNLFDGLAAAVAANLAAKKLIKEATKERRRSDPFWQARRSDAAKKGWETRRAAAEVKRKAAEADDALYNSYYVPTGPTCDGMSHNGIGSEIFCNLPPHPEEDDCDDLNGNTWQY